MSAVQAQLFAEDAERQRARTAARLIDGVGEWWVYPTATFLSAPDVTCFGAISANGDILACAFNHGTQKTKRVVVGQAIVDEHCRPALYVERGHRSVILWNNHGADGTMHCRVGAIDSISRWGDDQPFVANLSGLVSYAQIHRITSLSTATDDVFLVFYRVAESGTYIWRLRKLTVNKATGLATWTDSVTLIGFGAGQGYVQTAPATLENGNQGIRCGASTNPADTGGHDIYYFEIDAVTGAIRDQAHTALGNTGYGSGGAASGIPLTSTSLPAAVTIPAGSSARLLAVRPGPEKPGLAYTDWLTSNLVATYHHIGRWWYASDGLSLPTVSAYASTPKNWTNPASVSVRVVADVPTLTPAADGYLVRRYVAATNQRMWFLRLQTTGVLQFTWSTNGTAALANVLSTVVCPAGTNGFGVDFDPAVRSVTFKYSTDHGATWNTLGAAVTGAATSIFNGTAPLEVGSSTDTSAIGVYRSVTYGPIGGAALASQDFIAGGWSDRQTTGATDTDPQGNVWTLFTGAVIQITNWERHDLGDPGSVIGYVAGVKYVAGMGYPNPANGEVVYVARESAGTWSLERHWRESEVAGWQSETGLMTSTRKLARPECPLGGGPFPVLLTSFSHYGTDYTDYDGDIVAVAT
jgi:hypothetical protein